jgi:hypothetical protein
MNDEINLIEASEVVYQRGQNDSEQEPEFKPGNTPHTQYGSETLNANVPWDQVVIEILTRDYTIAALAEKIKSTTSVVNKVLQQDFSTLNFRTGARILGVHCQLFPENFV